LFHLAKLLVLSMRSDKTRASRKRPGPQAVFLGSGNPLRVAELPVFERHVEQALGLNHPFLQNVKMQTGGKALPENPCPRQIHGVNRRRFRRFKVLGSKSAQYSSGNWKAT
jgi:hypothetical protein